MIFKCNSQWTLSAKELRNCTFDAIAFDLNNFVCMRRDRLKVPALYRLQIQSILITNFPFFIIIILTEYRGFIRKERGSKAKQSKARYVSMRGNYFLKSANTENYINIIIKKLNSILFIAYLYFRR